MPRVCNPDANSSVANNINGFFEPIYNGRRMLPCEVPGFKYRGGKYMLRRQIIRFCKLSGHTFIEPYAGRANVTLLMRVVGKFNHWIVNDISTLDFLQAVVNYNGRRLPRIGQADIGGKGGYEKYAYRKHPDQEAILLMEPMLFWSGGRRGSSTPSGKPFGSDSCYDDYRERLLKAKFLLSGVTFRSDDASTIITEFGSDSRNFMYIDPPYIGANVGAYKDFRKERRRMIDALTATTCPWILSEYLCDDLLEAFGTPIAKIRDMVDVGSKYGQSREEVECLYSNYSPQLSIMDFGDSPKLIPITIDILRKAGGRIDYETWNKLCPLYWKNPTKLDQFKKLSRQPNTYYDGWEIFLVE